MDTGQLLGRVGNTGESGAPYLHFHISDGPAPLASNGLPFVITRFSWSGTVTNLDDFLTGTAPASVRARARRYMAATRETPLQETILDFVGPPARSGDRARYPPGVAAARAWAQRSTQEVDRTRHDHPATTPKDRTATGASFPATRPTLSEFEVRRRGSLTDSPHDEDRSPLKATTDALHLLLARTVLWGYRTRKDRS
jgi:murein DD-endopeptidase MepM/ murein hydrolase activator NlpD